MAKRKKKSRHLEVAGFRIPRSALRAGAQLAASQTGRVLIAEALLLGAGILAARNAPSVVSDEAEGGETRTPEAAAVKSASDRLAGILSMAAERLRGDEAGTPHRPAPGPGRRHAEGAGATGGRAQAGLGGGIVVDVLQDAFARASREKKKRGKKLRAKAG